MADFDMDDGGLPVTLDDTGQARGELDARERAVGGRETAAGVAGF